MTKPTLGVETTTRRAGAWQATLLLAGSCMPVMGSVLITPVLPQLSEHFGDQPGTDVLVPMIVAIPALMIALFAPFAGQIVDRAGRKNLLIVAMFAYALAGTVPAWIDSLTGILISRAFVGLFEAAIMTVCTTLIVDYFHEEHRRNRYLSLQTVATTLGATLFIVIGGAVGSAGWHAPFWIYAIAIPIAVAMIFSLWEPSREDSTDRHVPTGEKSRVPWRILGLPLIVTVFGGFTFYVMIIEVSYLVAGTGVAADDTATIGLVAAIASLATAAGAFTFPRIAKTGTRVLLPLAFGLQAVGMIVVWLFSGFAGVVVGAIVAGYGSGILLPSLLTWVVSRTRFEERGRATGWWTSAFFFGQFATPLLIGAITGASGAPLPVAVGAVGITAGIVAALLAFGLRRHEAVTSTAV
ncbi:MFS family permease [Microbacterium trichothecenolyticum]|uniref:MFS transporter n=1 Tax=Microbacterium trichothecenolyticum TaxID=69370 RepID=UPI002865F79E|nr:MFS transporter [Microbacterium trichothecenolyticum]MDR7110202.1 MFS family permease [Microbacterium trichothecenolyticum]